MPEMFCSTEAPDEVSKAFVSAVKGRDVDKVDSLLSDHPALRANISQPWFSFDSPAIIAAKDSEAIIKALLKHGADINARSSWWAGSFGVLDGASPEMAQFLIERGAKLDLHSAAEQGKIDLVEELLDRGPELVNSRGGDGQTPLHVASTIEICDLLLDRGAEFEIRCLDHSATAAQYAVTHPEKCEHLVMRGATPDIFMACALGNRELFELVLQEEPDSLNTRVGFCSHTSPVDRRSHLHIYTWKLLSAKTPLEVCREFNHPQLYSEVYDRSPNPLKLIAACWQPSKEKVQALLDDCPEIMNQLTVEQKKEMARAAWEGRLESVRLMLKVGFDPHLPGDDNSTPLDRAAFHGYREIVELLLEADSEPPLEHKNAYGGTPLSACAFGATHSWKQGTDHVGTAKALIKAGAKFSQDWLPIENEVMDRLFRSELGL